MDIGKAIRQLRKKRGLTQKELGLLVGMSYQQIGQYESGKRTPKIETIEKISQALETSPYEMLGNNYTYMKYPVLKELDVKNNAFENYLSSLGYSVNVISCSTKLDMAAISCHMPDWENDEKFISAETISYELIKDNEKIVLTDVEYDNLQKNIENFIEFELWKSTKLNSTAPDQGTPAPDEAPSPNQEEPTKN